MKPVHARAIAYAAVALLAFAAIRANPPAAPAPRAAARLATDTVPAAPESTWVHATDTLGRGESLSELFARIGVAGTTARDILVAATSIDERRVPAGMPVALRRLAGDSLPTELVFRLGVDRLVYLSRTAEGWAQREERLPWHTDTVAIGGAIASTLSAALDEAATALPRGLRAELAWEVADIFEYRVDMSRDLRAGEEFRVLVERSRTDSGHTRLGRILAVSFDFTDGPVQAFRVERAKGQGRAEYYDANGKSLRAAFLRAPLQFRRISSVYGRRYHPILGRWKAHRGTDYAAASGTPVRAIGNGTVIFSGVRSGYGNVVEIRHRNGYVTRYAHLRGFARAGRRGASVAIGQTIGYVGMTGLATGPHLHFEVLVGGKQRDPRVALRDKAGEPLAPGERATFATLREQRLALLEGVGVTARLAARE
ncbi:MAG TPA: peptidoglycan DD-metalloendopeptidase family protein [Gemmatimonadaceae bacterium]|nr:peptidoglycan DD-metalloendopeptidase family protein [Gemmatimonadaceae bacterium]